ncbi:biliverdin-producing heme oxygenase [Methylopila sp. Yamaguchi]|uniref:biliverdin-producing heme oxygenase n=1 Tax=Methylopila sp. Yamaguchi TaxID=1437817 RepID=UPI000CA890C7|nr:biliverdin-producing heme oxygenase [Methylopila sp. Yamaguchi]GBD48809.1 heme oxygenase [Methylopila sp. Yamaguchi]
MADAATDLIDRPAESRVQTLRRATHDMHERLDARIMQAKPFASRASYVRFLEVQRRFHADVAALYADARLQLIAPDLASRAKLALIEQDLRDLGAEPAPLTEPAVDPSDLPAALGWLYVAEGSSLGAAFLLKEALKLGLDPDFGARHLAAHPEGRGLHWRRFTQALDDAPLNADEDARAVAGAAAAFARVRALVDDLMPK